MGIGCASMASWLKSFNFGPYLIVALQHQMFLIVAYLDGNILSGLTVFSDSAHSV